MNSRLIGCLLVSASALLGASPAPPAPPAPKSFVLDSIPSTYPFTIRVEGTFERKGDTFVVTVKSGEVRSAIPLEIGEAGLAKDVRIAFGLGRTVESGWQMVHETADQTVAPKLAPGESVPLGPMTFVVSGFEDVRLGDEWLVARLGVMQQLPGVQAGLLWSYACSEDNLLGPTDASRTRANLMKTAYSHTC